MSTVPITPRRSFYIRIFSICLVIIVTCLLVLLFGVQMEASVPATGILSAQGQQNLRASVNGAVKLGWYAELLPAASGKKISCRVDGSGQGLAQTEEGTYQTIEDYRLPDGRVVPIAEQHFHRLQSGDQLWPGQPIALILNNRVSLPPRKDFPAFPAVAVEERFTTPNHNALWQVLKVHSENNAPVQSGTLLVTITPIDPKSHQPVDVVAHLQVAEEFSHELAVGQEVHLYSNVFNPRLHGHAEAKIIRIDPLAEPQADGKRYFNVVAAVGEAPFPLRLGSGVSAKIILGKKTVYRLILEH